MKFYIINFIVWNSDITPECRPDKCQPRSTLISTRPVSCSNQISKSQIKTKQNKTITKSYPYRAQTQIPD